MRGLDPRIHAELRLGKALPLRAAKPNANPNVGVGCRIKSGNDAGERAAERAYLVARGYTPHNHPPRK